MQPAAARSPLGPPSARSGSLGGAAVRDELPVTNVQILTRAGTRLGKATGVPPWVALPTVLATSSLLCALFGMLFLREPVNAWRVGGCLALVAGVILLGLPH